MSKPTANAPQKPNFLITALWMITIFLAIQLFLKPQNPVQSGPLEDQLAKLKVSNAKILDQSIVAQHQAYEQSIDAQVKDKKLTEAQADEKKLEAAIITADTQLKAGIERNDSGRIRAAYFTLIPFHKRLGEAPVWNETFGVSDVSSNPKFGWKDWTGGKLYDFSITTLSEHNKHDLIWGFIPGGYAFIDALVHLTGAHPDYSYAVAALILALIVRGAIYPLAQKQFLFSRQMSQLAPLVAEIKDKYKDDTNNQNLKVMELYKEYGVNPAAGCGPALVQMPLFLTVYQCMLLYQFEFIKGTFLWVNPETSRITHGITAPNLGQLDAVLIVIYGITMTISTLLTPVTDPTQKKQQRLIGVGMSLFITVTMFFGLFPVPGAFVLYWIFLNILATAQALRAYGKELPPLVKVNAAGGGVYPTTTGGKWAKRMEEMMRAAEQQRANGGAAPASIDTTPEAKTGTPAKHKPKKRK